MTAREARERAEAVNGAKVTRLTQDIRKAIQAAADKGRLRMEYESKEDLDVKDKVAVIVRDYGFAVEIKQGRFFISWEE